MSQGALMAVSQRCYRGKHALIDGSLSAYGAGFSTRT